MEVEIKLDNNTVLLRDIKVGECFMFNGKLYMKTDMDLNSERICVRMDNGSCKLFMQQSSNVQKVIMSKVVARTYSINN